jgi:ribonuclease HII
VRFVAGVDEVGRGAWAGPLSVAIAIVNSDALRARIWPDGLRDSKALPEVQRESLFDELTAWCVGWAVGHATSQEIDSVGLTAALTLASQRAFAALSRGPNPEVLIVDGPVDFLSPWRAGRPPLVAGDTRPRVVPVVGGDARCVSVAAASILAKVTRDRQMRELALVHPEYGFERNKGYPTPSHQKAVSEHGLTSIHRRSWNVRVG